jgi:formylmethanofuran dehydrogenase subunit E
MDRLAAAIRYAIVTCDKCGREMAVNMANANDKILCADCDRVVYRYLVNEEVLPIEDDCAS